MINLSEFNVSIVWVDELYDLIVKCLEGVEAQQTVKGGQAI